MYEPDLYDPRQPHQLAVVGTTLCFIQPQDASGVNMWTVVCCCCYSLAAAGVKKAFLFACAYFESYAEAFKELSRLCIARHLVSTCMHKSSVKDSVLSILQHVKQFASDCLHCLPSACTDSLGSLLI